MRSSRTLVVRPNLKVIHSFMLIQGCTSLLRAGAPIQPAVSSQLWDLPVQGTCLYDRAHEASYG